MPDFSKLMKAPAGVSKPPKALPMMDAPGIVKSFELLEAPKGRDYETIVRCHLVLTGWGDNIPEDEKVEEFAPGEFRPIDLTKRRLRRDFYDNAMYLLDETLRSCNIEPQGQLYEEVLPHLVGARVMVQVQQYLNQNTNVTANQVGRVTGLEQYEASKAA